VKFDDLLAQYLYETKKLQLQGIGSFELDKAITVNHEHDKEIYYPIEGLTFTYNPKEITPEDLITFLVKRLGKIQPLVRSDLDSYLSNIKQFINIGKPYTIEGIGTLNKNNQGTYEFTPGNFLPAKEELSPKRDKTEPSLRPMPASNNGGRALVITLIILAVIAVLGGIGWGVYTFLGSKEPQSENTSNQAVEETATADTTTFKPTDTAATSPAPTPIINASDSVNYKMIFEITKLKNRAYSRTAFLRKSGINSGLDSVVENDLLNYRLFIPVKALSADTTRLKDSLYKFFNRPITVDKY
jgi:hypothetical protein